MAGLLGTAEYGDVISFEVYPANIIGNNFKQVKLVGLVDVKMAALQGIDPYVLHKQVYTFVPDGKISSQASEYMYAVVEFANGQRQTIGVPWINLATLTVHRSNNVIFVTQNLQPTQIEMVREFMAANGITLVSHMVKDPNEVQRILRLSQ